MTMNKPESAPDFVYVSYIKSPPQKIWDAITTPEFSRQYWRYELHSTWKKGAQWNMLNTADQKSTVIGDVLESTPPRRLVMSWAEPAAPAIVSRVTFEIESLGDTTRLTVIHSELDEQMGRKIGGGWPRVLCGLKSLLETGTVLDIWADKKVQCEA
jgi:uncharacterized protein YndB with AHSA1/START domain